MPKVTKPYHTFDGKQLFTYKQLMRASSDVKLEAMEAWFRERYTDPVECCPYISTEGGYQYIFGGPYTLEDILPYEFPDEVFKGLVDELSSSLTNESWYWSPIPDDDSLRYEEQYEEYLRFKPFFDNFLKALQDINSLINVNLSKRNKQILFKMAYSNVITVLETYLSDVFVYLVTGGGKFSLKYSLGKKKDKNKKLKLSEYHKPEHDFDKRKSLMTKKTWHRLADTETLFKKYFGVSFNSHKKYLEGCIDIRHDLIHRNGKNINGIMVHLSKGQIMTLISRTKKFIKKINDDLLVKLEDGSVSEINYDDLIDDEDRPY